MGNSLGIPVYIFVLQKVCGLAADCHRLSGYRQRAAANGSSIVCSVIAVSIQFAVQVVPKGSKKKKQTQKQKQLGYIVQSGRLLLVILKALSENTLPKSKSVL